jgi:pyruvate formate lyase activating enzyme
MPAIVCDVCPRACRLQDGQTGFCNVRKNVGGENVDSLYGLFYPNPETHNAPGSYTAVYPGCNLKCWFCCVPFISTQFTGDTSTWPTGTYRRFSESEFADRVKASAGPNRGGFTCGLMGLFGGEPAIHWEHVVKSARIARDRGLASKIHTAGYVSGWVIEKIASVVDVISFNVKGSLSPAAWKKMNADPVVVQDAIRIAWKALGGEHHHYLPSGASRAPKRLQFNNLLGPGLDPTEEESRSFGEWLARETDAFIHVNLETMYGPLDHFLDQRTEFYEFVPGDDKLTALSRIRRIGDALFDGGLENVSVLLDDGASVRFPLSNPQGLFGHEAAKM